MAAYWFCFSGLYMGWIPFQSAGDDLTDLLLIGAERVEDTSVSAQFL